DGRDQGKVEGAGGDLGQQGAGAGLAQPQLDPGVLGVEAPEHGQQVDGRGQDLHRPDGQGPAPQALHGRDRVGGRRRRGQGPPGLGEQGQPGLGELDPSRATDEQGSPQLPLKGPDRGRQPRLDDVQPLGRPGEVAFLGRGHEMLELPQLHDPSPRSLNPAWAKPKADGTARSGYPGGPCESSWWTPPPSCPATTTASPRTAPPRGPRWRPPGVCSGRWCGCWRRAGSTLGGARTRGSSVI